MFEIDFRDFEENLICGIDEVGRGPLAGPVVTCAIIMPKDQEPIEGVRDSKKLSEKKRLLYKDLILESCIGYAVNFTSEKVIDEINIKQATRLSMKKSLESIRDKDNKLIRPDLVLIDAETIDTDIKQKSFIKGDDRLYPIACASIVAKVIRDQYMVDMSKLYPEYGFEKHKGYGTKLHREMIVEHGPCPIHRRTFLKKII
ncbi:MAG: ribonuclease HII [Finegoldia sp.]|nr:ribonuclease HII [Finegoldia sp.]